MPDRPTDLGPAGVRLWDTITADGLILRPDESALLDQACRVADQVETLAEVVASSPVVIAGSRGQEIVHPAVAELRLQRSLLASLVAKIAVPDGEGEGDWDGLSASERARKASRARWDRRAGGRR